MNTYPQNKSSSLDQNQTGANPGSPSSSTSSDDKEKLKDNAKSLAGQAKSEARDKVDEMRGTAADKIQTLADSAKAAASELEDDDIGHLSTYVEELAQSLGQLSSNMREKTGDDLLHEVSRLAHSNPALFVTGSIAIGFGLARFAKASEPTQPKSAGEPAGATRWAETRSTGSADAGPLAARATGYGSTTPSGAQRPTQTNQASDNNASGNGQSSQQRPGVSS